MTATTLSPNNARGGRREINEEVIAFEESQKDEMPPINVAQDSHLRIHAGKGFPFRAKKKT